MDFNELEDWRKTIRQFAEKEVMPRAKEVDEKEEFPAETIKLMGSLGYMGIPISKEHGGLGLDYLHYAIAVEEISRACGSTGLVMAAHTSLVVSAFELFGNPGQKKRYLAPLAKGEIVGAFGLTEPEAGSDAGSTKTKAVPSNNGYVINGTKCFITSAEVAAVAIVTAKTDAGISSFILEKGTKGFSYGKKEKKLGVRGSITGELVFQDCWLPKENLLGKEGEGFKQFLKILDGGRISIGAMAVGIAQGALDRAISYSKTRVQFGKPIAEFQAIQFMLAQMATKTEAARQLLHHAARLKDSGKRYTREAAMAKGFASEVAMAVTIDAIQIHGGYGYMKEYEVERMFRDAKLTEIGEGTTQIQLLVIARDLLR
jgi:butyryl-CoA dehydrogenase